METNKSQAPYTWINFRSVKIKQDKIPISSKPRGEVVYPPPTTHPVGIGLNNTETRAPITLRELRIFFILFRTVYNQKNFILSLSAIQHWKGRKCALPLFKIVQPVLIKRNGQQGVANAVYFGLAILFIFYENFAFSFTFLVHVYAVAAPS